MKIKLVLYITLLLVFAILFNSCGTTHHFVPPRPLENKEYLISVNWHFDFESGHLPAIVPDLNFYTGIDDRHIVGFGYQFPLFCSHITIAKYFINDNNSNWNIFTHFNQPFGLNNNPYFELGMTISNQEEKMWQSISAGLAYGNGATIHGGLFSLKELEDEFNSGSKNKFMPFIKLQLGGNDLAFSFNEYFGHSRSVFTKTLINSHLFNDTILALPTSDIDSIVVINSEDYYYNRQDSYGIFLNNGDTVLIQSEYEGMGCFPNPQMYNSRYNDVKSLYEKKGFQTYFITPQAEYKKSNLSRCLLLPDELLQNWDKNEMLVILYFPKDIKKTINEHLKKMEDYSIGISIQNYNFRK